MGGAAGGETAEGHDGVGMFQSVSEDSQRVSADDCDCAKPGAGVVDRINAFESGNGDEVVAEYLFDAGDGENGKSDWKFDGGFESGECEIARSGSADRAGVNESRLRKRARCA